MKQVTPILVGEDDADEDAPVQSLTKDEVWAWLTVELKRSEQFPERVIRLHVFSHHTDDFYSLEQWLTALQEYCELVEEQGSARLWMEHYASTQNLENDEMELENDILHYGPYPY
jgi:hypothetical protein